MSVTNITNVPCTPCSTCPISVATPDGGLLYIGFRSITYIAAPTNNAEGCGAHEVKNMSTRFTINALDISPLWAKISPATTNGPFMQFAIVAEDATVQVWDCGLGEAVSGHKAHQHQQEAREIAINGGPKKVLMSYLSNGNILSLDAIDLVIYCVASNSYCRRASFINRSHNLTVLSCSPYSENVFALGTMQGHVLVCDLRQMRIMFKFSGHKNRICGLSWKEMPTTVDKSNYIEPLMKAEQRSKPIKTNNGTKPETDDPFDIYNFDHLEGEFGAPSKLSTSARRISKSSSDECTDFVGLEKPANAATEAIDYIEACENMKAHLIAHQNNSNPDEIKSPIDRVEVTLEDCAQLLGDRKRSDSSFSGNQSATILTESTEGSLELLQYSCSSDDAVIIDGDAPKPKHEVLHHIYHQAEVHATNTTNTLKSMSPEPDNPKASTVSEVCSEASTMRPDILLASIDAHEVTMLWNTLTGAHCSRSYLKHQGNDKDINVRWLQDDMIVTHTNHKLQFYRVEWDIKSNRYKLLQNDSHKCPMNQIISFATCPNSKQIWIFTKDRQVALLNSLTGQLDDLYSCMSFGIRTIVECPDDMNKIALGCNDKRIALFDISKLYAHCTSMNTVFTSNPIYAIVWSPDSTHLAYSTNEGAIGIIKTDSLRILTTYRGKIKKPIYSLAWEGNYIYFVVNHKIAVLDVTQPNKDAKQLNIPDATCISVRSGFLFVGLNDGYMQLHERQPNIELTYKMVRKVPLISRYITEMVWNPLKQNIFAIGGNDKHIHILEFQPQDRNFKTLHTFEVNDPNAYITALKWSNQNEHLLLTCHIEGKICIWNTLEPNEEPLTITFHCPIFSAIFLPSDENIIMCSGKTISIEFVNIKDVLEQRKKSICLKVDTLLNVKWAGKSSTQPFTGVLSAAEKKRQRTKEKRAEKRLEKKTAQTDDLAQQATKPSEKKLEEKLSKLYLEPKINSNDKPPTTYLAHNRTCLYLTQKDLNKNALVRLATVLTEDAASIEKTVLVAKLFSTKMVAKELLSAELTNLKQSNTATLAPVWLTMANFKLRDELEEHIKNKTLTEWHLTLAPSISYSFWTECCKVFANQLQLQGYMLHAATYLIAIHQTTEAVDLLLENKYFKEALVLARVYLPATDPIMKNIINNWLTDLENTGNLSAAALICVLDNEMLRGYNYLRKIRNRTEEVSSLMEQIKQIGQLSALLDDEQQEEVLQGNDKKDE